jgi:hypothetical protein
MMRMAWRLAMNSRGQPPARPVLQLSGPRLMRGFEALVADSEREGGVESYVKGLRLKSEVFREMLGAGRVAGLTEDDFLGLCAFMAPVRRRIGAWLQQAGFETTRALVQELLDGAEDTATADARLVRFVTAFPEESAYRWARDLAAEVLHYVDPERYPLMTRWIWDRRANTGVLREIWWGDDVDRTSIEIADQFETFVILREELAGFLSDNGVFRDVPFYVDLLCARLYAEYVAEQGEAYLRADFTADQDPMWYARRQLGLDGVDPETGRTRTKRPDGRPHVLKGGEPVH